MPALEAASLAVAIGSLLIETPRIATGIYSLKSSASELAEKTEARLKEILKEMKENHKVINQAQVATILLTHSQHKAQLVKLRQEYPRSFTFIQWWNKRRNHCQEVEALHHLVEDFYVHAMEVSESASAQAILESMQLGASEAHVSSELSPVQIPASESAGSSIYQFPLSGGIPLQPILTIAS